MKAELYVVRLPLNIGILEDLKELFSCVAALYLLGQDCMAGGNLEKAIELYEQALEGLTSNTHTDPADLVTVLLYLGQALQIQGQYEKSLQVLERCLCVARECLPENNLALANIKRFMSLCCGLLGDGQRAMQLGEESFAIACQCLSSNVNHPHMVLFMQHLATCYGMCGDPDKAIGIIKPCVMILRQNLPSTRKLLCSVLLALGSSYSDNGIFDKAIEVYEECLQVQRSFLPPLHPFIGFTLGGLGVAYAGKGNDDVKAAEVLRECLLILDKSVHSTNFVVAIALHHLSEITLNQEQYEQSLYYLGRLYDSLAMKSPESAAMADVCFNMALCYLELSQWNLAEEAFSQSLRIFSRILPQGHDIILQIEELLHYIQQEGYFLCPIES
jgi:tetratricopeptide (TPR) repeat protein